MPKDILKIKNILFLNTFFNTSFKIYRKVAVSFFIRQLSYFLY